MAQRSAQARLGPVDELDLRPVFQPIVELRDGAVVGYEALVRGREDGDLYSAHALLAAARREDSMLALDLAARDAALRRRSGPASTRRSRSSSTPIRRRSTAARPIARRRG
jgi:EAL domain-containing protein (putative c-di-GMP-specific phosphodiesterase class I)